jgi:hypothetical protein
LALLLDPGWIKIRIRDKHSESTTLLTIILSLRVGVTAVYLLKCLLVLSGGGRGLGGGGEGRVPASYPHC